MNHAFIMAVSRWLGLQHIFSVWCQLQVEGANDNGDHLDTAKIVQSLPWQNNHFGIMNHAFIMAVSRWLGLQHIFSVSCQLQFEGSNDNGDHLDTAKIVQSLS